jgi:AcrR family transcriptional regulator
MSLMQNRSLQTRQRLLAAALIVFARDGYDHSSVNDICAEAGVSKGAFFHHFPTKQALFLELLDEWLAALDAQLESIRLQDRKVPEALIEMAGLMSTVYLTASGYLPVFLEFWTQASHDPAIRQAVIAPYHRYQSYFTSFIQAGVDEGSLKPVDPVLAARTLVAQAIGLLLQGVLDPQGADWASETRRSVELLVHSIQRENP